MIKGPEKLEDFEITPRDLAADYWDGGPVYDEYTSWLNYCAGGNIAKPAAYATFLDHERSKNMSAYNGACSRFRRWENQNHSKPIAGCVRAHAMGLFSNPDGEEYNPEGAKYFDPTKLNSFTPDHKYFRLTCLLASMIYSTGTIADNKGSKGGTSKKSNIACRELEGLTFLEPLIDFLEDLGWNKTPGKKDGALNAVISRILPFMGFKPGRKQGLEDPLPDIFGKALNTYEDEESKFGELAKEILTDFVLTFIITRAFLTTRKQRRVGFLVSRSTREIADQQAEVFMKLIKVAGLEHLGCELGPRDLRIGDKSAPVSSYTHAVDFRNMNEAMFNDLRSQMNQRVERLLSEAGA